MRTLLLALVLANLLALAWWQGWTAAWRSPAGTPAGSAGEIAPERLRVVPIDRLELRTPDGSSPGAAIPAAPARSDGGAEASPAIPAGSAPRQ
ncbi:MAG TPA: hypothetical protein VN324_10810 [Quisquiliibacterium sp.]|nr:hypothetical protein [Quisquiliibacterium sp.]